MTLSGRLTIGASARVLPCFLRLHWVGNRVSRALFIFSFAQFSCMLMIVSGVGPSKSDGNIQHGSNIACPSHRLPPRIRLRYNPCANFRRREHRSAYRKPRSWRLRYSFVMGGLQNRFSVSHVSCNPAFQRSLQMIESRRLYHT